VGFQDILNDIRERLVRVETKLDILIIIPEKVDSLEAKTIGMDAHTKANIQRINNLEDNNKWLWRTIVGAIIVALISGITALIQKGG